MAVTQYEKDGKIFWRVYVDLHSRKNARIRIQKRVNGLKSEREAYAEEKRLIRELSEELAKLESKGLLWSEVIEHWVRQQELYPTRSYTATTVQDYAAMMVKWTKPWLNRNASELNRGDGREIDRIAQNEGKSSKFRIKLKSTINIIYRWGIEERHIQGVQESPVFGLEIKRDRDEKRQEVLTIEETRNLLRLAKQQNNRWYPVWVGAVLTGCRSGELHELRRSDLEVISREKAIEEDQKPPHERRYGFIRVRKSWTTRFRKSGPTKSGFWRTVPVSSELYWFLHNELKVETMHPDEHIFPQCWAWDKGEQARFIRGFCQANGLPSIKFHTLRACFATQLISTGVPATVVMKICGWQDMKTMQRYIRLAGIEEAGATEVLKFIPTEEAVMEKVVSMYDHRR